MITFTETPNLPQNKVQTLICGKADETIYRFIKSFGIEIITSETNCAVDTRISDHADISVHHLGGKNILLDSSQRKLADKLIADFKMNVLFTHKPCSGEYPRDCALNFLRLDNILLGKLDCMDETLRAYADSEKIIFHHVRQGYAKCASVVVGKNAVITDDSAICKALQKAHCDCLLIEKGDVQLIGFDYGFIGGSAGFIDKNHLLFFGDITKHRSFDKIELFLNQHGVRYDFIKDYPLTDIGGIIPIRENA